jgi:glycosyltransferase involved in cell wall biosynthesis
LVISDRRFKVVRFSRNFRHQAALLVGYEFAKGDVIVSLDADLQDPP